MTPDEGSRFAGTILRTANSFYPFLEVVWRYLKIFFQNCSSEILISADFAEKRLCHHEIASKRR